MIKWSSSTNSSTNFASPKLTNMKVKHLFFAFFLTAFFQGAHAQGFTPGNVVVYRYGDGAAAMPLGTLVPVFLDEYTPGGTLVSTKAIPSTTNGINFGLTGLGRLGSGLYQQEGMSTISADGKYITIFGYNGAPGATVPTTANGLVVGVVAADGSYNSSTTLSNAASTGLGAPRSAIVKDNEVWANGYQNGVQYTTMGALSTSTRVSVSQNSPRTMTIFGDTLYAPIGGGNTLAKTTPLPRVSTTFGTQTLPSLPGPVTTTTNQVVLFTVGTRTRMYLADDGAATGNTIRRYYLNTGGTAWVADGTVNAVPSTTLLKGISGVATVSGSLTVIDIYATTWGNDGNGTEASKLLKFTDTYVTATPSFPPSTSALTTLATSPANTVFRSVTMAPVGSANVGLLVLPISLQSFNAGAAGKNNNIWWSTSSETNVQQYSIEKSTDAINYESIGTRTATNSDQLASYAFTDNDVHTAISYYRLKIVNQDGSFSYSPVIMVKTEAGITGKLRISPNPVAGNAVNIFHAKAGVNSVIKIISLEGRMIHSSRVPAGATQSMLLLNHISKGNYVVEFVSQSGKQTTAMIKL